MESVPGLKIHLHNVCAKTHCDVCSTCLAVKKVFLVFKITTVGKEDNQNVSRVGE